MASAIVLLAACAESDDEVQIAASRAAIDAPSGRGPSPAEFDLSVDEEDIPIDEQWELTPVQLDEVPVASDEELAESSSLRMTEAEWQEAYENAMNDPLWYSEDGVRYDALFISEDGVVYGRRGPAGDYAVPSEENGFGASEGSNIEDSPDLDLSAFGDAARTSNGHTRNSALRAPSRPMGAFVGTDYWNDSRFRVPNATQLSSYPTRVIGALSGSGNTGSGGCTGSKVGPRSILTASHCIFTSAGSLTTSGFFNPGQRNSSTVNGSHAWSGVFLRDWRVGRRFDYAVLRGPDTSAFVSLGWLGVQWWNSPSGYHWKDSFINGYPAGPNHPAGVISNQRCNASPRTDKRCDGWMYGDVSFFVDSLFDLYENSTLGFYNDVSEGMSGSA